MSAGPAQRPLRLAPRSESCSGRGRGPRSDRCRCSDPPVPPHPPFVLSRLRSGRIEGWPRPTAVAVLNGHKTQGAVAARARWCSVSFSLPWGVAGSRPGSRVTSLDVAKRSDQEKATLRWRSALRADCTRRQHLKREASANSLALRQRMLLYPFQALATRRHLTGFHCNGNGNCNGNCNCLERDHI